MLAFSIWNAIWLIFAAFIFIAVLMMMFSVITDIFRDDELSGWGKAAWLIALLFFTFITLIIYVIARGDGMVKRSARQQAETKESFDAYVRETAGGGAASELEKASALHSSGQIDDAEYAALKAKILG